MKPEPNDFPKNSQTGIENGEIRRPIRRPYYLFRTPDNLGSYLQKENYRIVMARKELLCQFLAPASIESGERDARGKATQSLVYNMSKFQAQNLEPATSIPLSAIEAFEAAAIEFYSKDGISAHEARLRKHFKLPDPDLEPNCYWLYGPPENRNLLILWGCEARENSSIPMIEIPDSKGNNDATVSQKLRSRVMNWASMRKEAIKLINASGNPLARFIATPVFDKKGNLKELETVNGKLAASKIKKMRHVSKSEISAFQEAAENFYEEAYPDSGAITEYEKELRSHFKLPDPALKPSSFYKYGSKLFIVANPDDEEDECLYMVEDEELNIPPENRDDQERLVNEETIVERLLTKKTPKKLYSALGIIVVMMLACLALVVVRNIDGEGPHIVSAIAENNPQQVEVYFNEPIEPESFSPVDEAFIIKETKTGKSVEVKRAVIDPENEKAIILDTSEMQEGSEYHLAVYKLKDASFRKNDIEAGSKNAETSFIFQDTLPPNLPKLSAEGTASRKLMLIFDETLDRKSAENKRNYGIEGFDVLNAKLLDDEKTVILTAENKSNEIKQKGFVDKGRYNLTISDVTDNSSNKNPIRDPNAENEKDASEVHIDNFQYIDTVAPAIAEVDSPDQIVTRLTFREPVDPSTVIPDNISISGEEGDHFKVSMTTVLGAKPEVIEIHHASFYPGKEYSIQVINIADKAGNSIEFLTEPLKFRYMGPQDTEAPEVIEAKTFGEYRNITFTFNESVDPESVKNATFSLLSDGLPTELRIESIDMLDRDARKFSLTLKDALKQRKSYRLVYSGIKDKVGNTVYEGQSGSFQTGALVLAYNLKSKNIAQLSGTRYELHFNLALLKETATNKLNYRFSNKEIKIDDVEFSEEKPNTVIIELEEPIELTGQVLTVSNMKIVDLPSCIQYAVRFNF